MLSEQDKARIRAEEAFQAQVAAEAAGGQTPSSSAPNAKSKAQKKPSGCVSWLGYGILGLLVLGALGASFGSSGTHDPPARRATATEPSPTPAPAQRPAEVPRSQAARSADVRPSDGSQNIGVWNIKPNGWSTTRNVGGEYGTNAGEGETFVVVGFVLKNVTKETQNYSSIIDQPHLVLADGSVLDEDPGLTVLAGQQMVDGQIAPGLKRSGQAVFRVPSQQLGTLQFRLEFFGGQSAEWALGR